MVEKRVVIKQAESRVQITMADPKMANAEQDPQVQTTHLQNNTTRAVNKIKKPFKWPFIIGIASLLFPGCYSYKNQILFQGLTDTSYTASMVQEKTVIQRGDQLSILIYGLDEKTTAYFNTPMGGGQGGNMQMMQGGQGGGLIGYLVSEEGTIEFPKLGTIAVLGYSPERLRDSLQSWLLPWIKDPIANVRLLNFRVTYLTTDRAQTIIIMNNKTNIIQFLGLVGGITWTDRKNNVLVIRQVDDKRQVFHVDFTKKDVFQSPVYYLQPNDIVYVEPNQRKFIESNVQLISLATSIASTLSIFVLFINSLR
jgi:polysaccharide export outer membrane protein